MLYLKKYLLFLFLGFSAYTAHAVLESDVGPIKVGASVSIEKGLWTGKVGPLDYKTPEGTRHLYVGPAINAEYLLMNWLSLGGLYRGLFDTAKDGKTAIHDMDAFLKFMIRSSAIEDHINLYVMVPAGYSMLTDGGNVLATGHGFNVGALFGGDYFFANNFGFTASAGYVFRRINSETIAKKEKVSLNMHNFSVNLGLVARF